MQCHACGNDTSNPKFCSRSCSARYTNSATPKRLPLGSCVRCARPISKRVKFCPDCRALSRWQDRTKGDALTGDTQRYALIRGFARRAAREAGLLDACFVCGYSTHVECCHIIDIRSFSDETLLGEVNALSNLIGLCPNHHWEFDHGLLPDLVAQRTEQAIPNRTVAGLIPAEVT